LINTDKPLSIQVNSFVRYKIVQMVESQNLSMVRSTLARLRRGVGSKPGSLPEIWDITLRGIPEALVGKWDNPSYGEWAVHTTLTLFALHQQGKDIKSQCMSRDGYPLGTALRKLVKDEEDENRIKRRFDKVATADSMEEVSHHLRGLVQLMKAEDVPLDYPGLAEDLFRFQNPDLRDNIRLKWGREYYSFTMKDE
jgi:CRISPR system Cascade subunit CasB